MCVGVRNVVYVVCCLLFAAEKINRLTVLDAAGRSQVDPRHCVESISLARHMKPRDCVEPISLFDGAEPSSVLSHQAPQWGQAPTVVIAPTLVLASARGVTSWPSWCCRPRPRPCPCPCLASPVDMHARIPRTSPHTHTHTHTHQHPCQRQQQQHVVTVRGNGHDCRPHLQPGQ